MKQVTLSKTFEINLLISKDKILDIYNGKVTFSLITSSNSHSQEDLDKAQRDQNISFCRILSFVDNILNYSIIVERTDPLIQFYSEIENNVVLVNDISDVGLVACLHAKFNALCCNSSEVETVSMYDSREQLTFSYTSDSIEDEYTELPLDEDWCPNFSYWPKPWWHRADIGTYDAIHLSEEDYLKWLKSDELKEMDAITETLFNEIDSQFGKSVEGSGELIEIDFVEQRKKFKPKLVD